MIYYLCQKMEIRLSTHFLLYFVIFLHFLPFSSRSASSISMKTKIYEDSHSSSSSSVLSCGDLHNIRCPFTLEGHPQQCPSYHVPGKLSCENNRTILIFSLKFFYVMSIDYEKWEIQLIDPGLEKYNCSSMPQNSLSTVIDIPTSGIYYCLSPDSNVAVVYLNCLTNISDFPRYVNTSPCVNASMNMSTYVILDPLVSEIKNSCNTFFTSWMSSDYPRNGSFGSYLDVYNQMTKGFTVSYYNRDKRGFFLRLWLKYEINLFNYTGKMLTYLGLYSDQGKSFFYEKYDEGFLYFLKLFFFGILIRGIGGMFMLPRFIIAAPFVLPLLIYTIRKINRAMNANIEDFLDIYGDQMPIRYSYNDVKKMTNNFKEKLGQGGFGSVYKGSLRSNNRDVAIKILSSAKGDGQDFINEVAIIGKIHHVNVVQLIGFVAERRKQDLIYELMPNGSLEKYLFPREEGNLVNLLSWEKAYGIALGIARGIKYLHRGCGMRILHFDIKPHDILPDENYNPKVSDFGLARAYSMDASMISVTCGVRGTIGYMAPELFYRNIGGVSYKSDVYSFGMLLMEMAGRRKNLNTSADEPSQIYLPSWIYRHLIQGYDIEMEDATQEENKIAKKILIVALWCIKLKPVDRPSMTKVVEMLESDLELLDIPEKPFSIADCDEDEDIMLDSLV